jgi:prepilin-type processing-associated H-X9-DG protein
MSQPEGRSGGGCVVLFADGHLRLARKWPWRRVRPRVSGYTIMELLIATSVAGVMTFSVMKAATVVQQDYEVNRFNQRLSDWVLSVESLFLVRSDYQGLDLQAVVNAGLLDNENMNLDTTFKPPKVLAVRHLYGGSLEIGVPANLPKQYWAAHLAGLPADRRCMALLQHAVNVGSVVAVVNNTNTASSLSDWKSMVSYNSERSMVINFPAGYQILRQLDGTVMPVTDMIGFCDTKDQSHMALAILRRKM